MGWRIRTRIPGQRLPAATVRAGGDLDQQVEPGDFLLGRADGRKHDLLRYGQRRRLPPDDVHYAEYTHAALVVSRDGDLIEAVGTGVRSAALLDYVVRGEPYQVVSIAASEEDRRRVVEFAQRALAERAPYSRLAVLTVVLWAFTDSRLTVFRDGSYTCSGLVATALERTSAWFGTNPARVMPAQLAAFFGAPAALPPRSPGPSGPDPRRPDPR